MLQQRKTKDTMREKPSGIKLHIGVDILGLPHTIKITTANVTDRNGATDMISYYHKHTNNLSRMKKVLADSPILVKSLPIKLKIFVLLMLKSLNVMNFISLLLFPNVGLLNVLSLGLIIVVVSGKIAKHLSIILFKWFILLSSVFYSSDPKQVLRTCIHKQQSKVWI